MWFKLHVPPPIHTLFTDFYVGLKENSPGLLIAEFFGDHFSQLEPEAVGHFLGQVMVGAPAEQHDVGHGGNARALIHVCTDETGKVCWKEKS